jgi:hypothetical protein
MHESLPGSKFIMTALWRHATQARRSIRTRVAPVRRMIVRDRAKPFGFATVSSKNKLESHERK